MDGLLLREHRIVLPKSLQKTAVRIAHEGHLGVVKTKSLLKSKVWFPGLDKLVEEEISMCRICQCCTLKKCNNVPVVMSKMPGKVWDEISIDFSGPWPNGYYGLVLVDDGSRIACVKPTKSTSIESTIPKIDEVFATYGIPSLVRTDNGPPFNSKAFSEYCVSMGIKHRKITPLWPMANGKCERFMQNLNKLMTRSHLAGKNWQRELNTLLRSYNSAPHSTTRVAPVELMFNRNNFTRLPLLES